MTTPQHILTFMGKDVATVLKSKTTLQRRILMKKIMLKNMKSDLIKRDALF